MAGRLRGLFQQREGHSRQGTACAKRQCLAGPGLPQEPGLTHCVGSRKWDGGGWGEGGMAGAQLIFPVLSLSPFQNLLPHHQGPAPPSSQSWARWWPPSPAGSPHGPLQPGSRCPSCEPMSAQGAASLVQKPPRDPDSTLASWFISGHECIVSSPQPSISAQTPLVSVEETIVQLQAQFGEDTPILCPAQKTSRLVSSKSLCPWAVRAKAQVSWGWKLHQAGPLSPVSAERPWSSPATAGPGHFLSCRSTRLAGQRWKDRPLGPAQGG